jgi:hypothetical protein
MSNGRENIELSGTGAGMERDSHPMRLSEGLYGYALNGNISSREGDVMLMQNEGSNVCCSKLMGGAVCGYGRDLNAGGVYYFLSFVDGTSGIVFLGDERIEVSGDDTEVECGCNFGKILSGSLEASEERYSALCGEVTVILQDCTEGGLLGFDVRTPVYDIIFKDEKCGRRMYWSQKGKPARYVDFEKAKDFESEYYWKRKPLCGDGTEGIRTCLNIERLRVFPLLSIPCLDIAEVTYGGTLRSGVYEFLVAYCDASGSELSSYYSLTNPVPVFDESIVVVDETVSGRMTGLGIRLKVQGLDEQSSYYKIAVIQCADAENHTVCYFEGIHSITDRDVRLTSSALSGDYKEGDVVGLYEITTLQHLSLERPSYKSTEGMATSGRMLFQYGLEAEPEWNLQPVVNLMGCMLKWQVSLSKEELYQSAAACSKYVGYMRDEVYPFGIRFLTDTGYLTAVFPLIGRPKLAGDAEAVVTEDGEAIGGKKDVETILKRVPSCSGVDRKERWQFYNTASEEGVYEASDSGSVSEECEPVEVEQTRKCERLYYRLEGNPEEWIELDIPGTYDYLRNYINEHIEEICNYDEGTPLKALCDVFEGNVESNVEIGEDDKCNPANLFPSTCGEVERVEDAVGFSVAEIKGLNVAYEVKKFDSPDNNEYLSNPSLYIEQFGSKITFNQEWGRTLLFSGFSASDIKYFSQTSCKCVSLLNANILKAISETYPLIAENYSKANVDQYSSSTPLSTSKVSKVEIWEPGTQFTNWTTLRRTQHNRSKFHIKRQLVNKTPGVAERSGAGGNFLSAKPYWNYGNSAGTNKNGDLYGHGNASARDPWEELDKHPELNELILIEEADIPKYIEWKPGYFRGAADDDDMAKFGMNFIMSRDFFAVGTDGKAINSEKTDQTFRKDEPYPLRPPMHYDVYLTADDQDEALLLKKSDVSYYYIEKQPYYGFMDDSVRYGCLDPEMSKINLSNGGFWIKNNVEKGTNVAESLFKPVDTGKKGNCSDSYTGQVWMRWSSYLHKEARWFRIEMPEEWKTGSGLYDDGTEQYYILQYVPCPANVADVMAEKQSTWDWFEEIIKGALGINKTISFINSTDILTTSSKDLTCSPQLRITFFNNDKDLLGYPGTMIGNPFMQVAGEAPPVAAYHHYVEQPKLAKITKATFDGHDAIWIAVDSPVGVAGWIFNGYVEEDDSCEPRQMCGFNYFTSIVQGYFGFALIKPAVGAVKFSFSEMLINKIETFKAKCTYCIPESASCGVIPQRYGSFGYWESTETYPANSELFDSSDLQISEGLLERYGMSDADVSEFTSYYPIVSERIPTANFCQQPIRHFKMPDNVLVPFLIDMTLAPDADSIIYPLGVALKSSVVRALLGVAVNKGLITEEQFSHIIGYEIMRGDRTLNRGVVAAGLGYDMWKYKEKQFGDDIWFSNFPYNDLSDNVFIYAEPWKNKNLTSADYLKHPYSGEGNLKYTFHSPDTSFTHPGLPLECRIEGFQYGSANGRFSLVDTHPKWIVLTKKALNLARQLADVEGLATVVGAVGGVVGGAAAGAGAGGWVGAIVGALAGVLQSIPGLINTAFQKSINEMQWRTALTGFGTPFNFANYYASEGKYNFMLAPEDDSTQRGMTLCKYLGSGRYTALEDGGAKVKLNSQNRESSVFVSFGQDEADMVKYSTMTKLYDNSRVEDDCDYQEGEDTGSGTFMTHQYESILCSPYMKLKRYLPDQYGDIWSVQWAGTGGCRRFDADTDTQFIWGGDIFISRFTLKRKFPFFIMTAMGLGDMTPFGYQDFRNVGNPKYYVNFDTDETTMTLDPSHLVPAYGTSYKLVCEGFTTGREYYLKGKFYLYSYGIPSFLVESEINCWFRHAGKTAREEFYPHIGDYVDWTQEKNVSIKEDNTYIYNSVYSKPKSKLGYRMLPSVYERAFWDCKASMPNGIIWSEADVSENSLHDPWLTYKPLNFYEFPASLGKVVSVKGIESQQLLARFEHGIQLYNSIDVLRDRLGQTELGGSMFSQRQMEYNATDLGYAGTQSKEMVSCEFGHFWVDTERGQVFYVDPNGRNLKEITSGMMNWFKEHLPMKILRYGIQKTDDPDNPRAITAMDIDNKFAGIGITMGWDARFKRVFLTKRDYVPKSGLSGAMFSYRDGKFHYGVGSGGTEVSLRDSDYFEDVSFTVAYSCLTGRWISFYSFTPDYYVSHHHYFQTGINATDGETERTGLWTHLLTKRSYQVFYGDLYPFIIETPTGYGVTNRMLTFVEYWMESRRYADEWDYSVYNGVGFNKAWVYNSTNNSGELHLVRRKRDNTAQDIMYPRTVENWKDGAKTGLSSEILATETDGLWRFNDIFNRVRDDRNRLPIWKKDRNDLLMELDWRAIRWQTEWQDRMRGEWFMTRFVNDSESRYQMLFRLQGVRTVVN